MTLSAPEGPLSSPFLTEWSAEAEAAAQQAQTAPPPAAPAVMAESPLASPFSGLEAGLTLADVGAPSSTSATAAEVWHELRDEAFTESLVDLVSEARALLSEQPLGESAATRSELGEQRLAEHLEPLALAAEQMIDTVDREMSAAGPAGLGPGELEQLVDGSRPSVADPAMEGFLRGLGNVLKKGFAVAGKVVKTVALGPLLSLLRRAVRPLLEGVIKFALNRIPAPLRGVARQLAQKVLGLLGETPQGEQAVPGERDHDIAAPVTELESSFRAHLTAALLATDETSRENVMDRFAADVTSVAENTLEVAEDARETFVAQLVNSPDPQSTVGPATEQFLPALLALKPALSAAVSMIGRDRVVGTLAGLLSPLLAKFTDPQVADQLARALVGAGLSIVAEVAEAPRTGPGVPESVARALAQTLEEVVAGLPTSAEMLRDEAVLAAEALSAYESALPTIVPEQLLRAELRASNGLVRRG